MLQNAVEPTIEDYPVEAPVESGSRGGRAGELRGD